MKFLQFAFDAVCTQAKTPETWFCALLQHEQFYGGPEEGGWWGTDTEVVAYQAFASEDAAEEAANRVRDLAAELERDSRREFGEQCIREMEWLDARGLDADFLPEPDGETRYSVSVCQELPVAARGERQYS